MPCASRGAEHHPQVLCMVMEWCRKKAECVPKIEGGTFVPHAFKDALHISLKGHWGIGKVKGGAKTPI